MNFLVQVADLKRREESNTEDHPKEKKPRSASASSSAEAGAGGIASEVEPPPPPPPPDGAAGNLAGAAFAGAALAGGGVTGDGGYAAAPTADPHGLARPAGYRCSKCGLPKRGHVCASLVEGLNNPALLPGGAMAAQGTAPSAAFASSSSSSSSSGAQRVAPPGTRACLDGVANCERAGCTKRAATPFAKSGPRCCIAHGGGPRCTEPGCGKGALSGGLQRCTAHGGGRRCSEADCGRKAIAGGSTLKNCGFIFFLLIFSSSTPPRELRRKSVCCGEKLRLSADT